MSRRIRTAAALVVTAGLFVVGAVLPATAVSPPIETAVSPPIDPGSTLTTSRAGQIVAMHIPADDPSAVQLRDRMTPARVRAVEPMPMPEFTGPNPLARQNPSRPAAGESVELLTVPPQAPAASFAAAPAAYGFVEQGKSVVVGPGPRATPPASTVGKLLFYTPEGISSCTATVISTPNDSVIWTAGHCVNDGRGHWYSNFTFYPATPDGAFSRGVWTAKHVVAMTSWVDRGDYNYDFAAIVLRPQDQGRVAEFTGSAGVRFGRSFDSTVDIFGYPTSLLPSNQGVNGQLRFCAAPKVTRMGGTTSTRRTQCDMGPGSSGGPWFESLDFASGRAFLVGNTSQHETNTTVITSPYLGSSAITLLRYVENR